MSALEVGEQDAQRGLLPPDGGQQGGTQHYKPSLELVVEAGRLRVRAVRSSSGVEHLGERLTLEEAWRAAACACVRR